MQGLKPIPDDAAAAGFLGDSVDDDGDASEPIDDDEETEGGRRLQAASIDWRS